MNQVSDARRSAQDIALFVFIPFCKIKCTYCDFNAYANIARLMEPYADAVVQEISNFGLPSPTAEHQEKALVAKTMFFGGGTPSLVPIKHIEMIMRACMESFTMTLNPEITLEANPGTLNADKLHALRALGINRLSLGVQAFDDAVLRRLNRGHTVADALETFDLARRAGFDNLNIDLIYGLPLQTLDDWRVTVQRALALGPEHLSLYGLTVEHATGLEHQIRRGKYPAPDDDLAADMYEQAEEMLDVAGYEHYEISNWARRVRVEIHEGPAKDASDPSPAPDLADKRTLMDFTSLRSRHNLTYWHNEPYVGFGAGAHSCRGGRRYWNVLSPIDYIQRLERGEDVVAGGEEISRELEMSETMILGLRLDEGITFDAFADRYGQDPRDKYREQIHQVKELGLLDVSGRRMRLTRQGRLLSNQVFWRFLP